MRDQLLALLQPRFDAMRDEMLGVCTRRPRRRGGADVEASPIRLPEKGHKTSGIPARADVSESKSDVDAPVLEAVAKRGAPRQRGNGGFVADRDIKPANDASGTRRCSKCGEIGRRSNGCGISHNVAPAAPAKSPYVTAKGNVDRIAALRERQAARVPDAPISRAGDEDEEDLDEAIERAERRKKDGSLPNPRSSFAIDRGEVTELDFGGDA